MVVRCRRVVGGRLEGMPASIPYRGAIGFKTGAWGGVGGWAGGDGLWRSTLNDPVSSCEHYSTAAFR